ncbi:hypothetical protein Rcae01_05068 [Novipirellula caenicola]|uniref:Uncharacterized protein n=1 Tax=Novipirellula caenicola TaxID=1536901 RepID=A0ABP9VZA7_9BACT
MATARQRQPILAEQALAIAKPDGQFAFRSYARQSVDRHRAIAGHHLLAKVATKHTLAGFADSP